MIWSSPTAWFCFTISKEIYLTSSVAAWTLRTSGTAHISVYTPRGISADYLFRFIQTSIKPPFPVIHRVVNIIHMFILCWLYNSIQIGIILFNIRISKLPCKNVRLPRMETSSVLLMTLTSIRHPIWTSVTLPKLP